MRIRLLPFVVVIIVLSIVVGFVTRHFGYEHKNNEMRRTYRFTRKAADRIFDQSKSKDKDVSVVACSYGWDSERGGLSLRIINSRTNEVIADFNITFVVESGESILEVRSPGKDDDHFVRELTGILDDNGIKLIRKP